MHSDSDQNNSTKTLANSKIDPVLAADVQTKIEEFGSMYCAAMEEAETKFDFKLIKDLGQKAIDVNKALILANQSLTDNLMDELFNELRALTGKFGKLEKENKKLKKSLNKSKKGTKPLTTYGSINSESSSELNKE